MVKNLSVNVHNDAKIDKKYIHNIVKQLKKELEFGIGSIQINFINSSEIMRINKKYLNHDYSTDIITFDYSESHISLEGEIFISTDDAILNSKKYGVKFKNEIMRLIIHGFLHLLGYNDQSQKEKVVMKRLENSLYNRYRLIVN
jgi:probable rRNA maturation factor